MPKKPADHLKGARKLTEKQVTVIRKDYQNGKYSAIELADRYSTTPSNVYQIVNRKTWRHLC